MLFAEINDQKLKLLSAIDLDEVAEIAADIVLHTAQSHTVAVIMWDPDLESFGEKFIFGSQKKEMAKLAETFCSDCTVSESPLYELDQEQSTSKSRELEPVYCFRIEKGENLVSCILIAGSAAEPDELAASLHVYPFVTALSNAWNYRELERENERLRSQYEEMEDKTSMLEDQTIKLIHDLTVRETMRTRHVERERLVYAISNTVRSSLNIQQVLETAVKQICSTLGVSRCLLLRSVDSADQLNVYEFTQQTAPSIKHLFFSEAGFRFTSQALNRTSPHDLADLELDTYANVYDREFLKRLGIRSGLLVPLIMRERVLGVLFLQDCTQPRAWTIDDITLLGSLADNLSVAIENAELHLERERQAVTDGLTGVANRRSFNETFSREFERARRYAEPLSLVVIDLDYLKKINDTYGHQTGDEAIKLIGKLLKQTCRSVDMPARYGGEEFCLLLPNTEIDMAEQLADRLRRLINEVEMEGPGHISASLGVATYPLHADDPDTLFQKADAALYVAKQSGRNKVCLATENGESSLVKKPPAVAELQELQGEAGPESSKAIDRSSAQNLPI